jgi:thiol-disulfide isomerase/thioredoxin
LSVKPIRLHPTRRSIIAAASGLAVAGAWSNFSAAQTDDPRLPDAVDAMTKIMPTAAPHLVFSNTKGERLSLADYTGHALVVNLWATWCAPCIAEIPSFSALAPRVKSSGVLILPISIDLTGAAVVRPFYAAHGIHTLPILLDPNGENMQVLNTDSIPLTIILNGAGQLVARLNGAANWNTPRTIEFLQSLGGQAPAHKPTGFIPV